MSVDSSMSLEEFEAEEHGLLLFFRREVPVAPAGDDVLAIRYLRLIERLLQLGRLRGIHRVVAVTVHNECRRKTRPDVRNGRHRLRLGEELGAGFWPSRSSRPASGLFRGSDRRERQIESEPLVCEVHA